jgi:septal ring-binding cell division protein DamX
MREFIMLILVIMAYGMNSSVAQENMSSAKQDISIASNKFAFDL